ncbi:MAG: hypothetical protein R3B52_00885 [Candidatus Paceibacterota bacterium]
MKRILEGIENFQDILCLSELVDLVLLKSGRKKAALVEISYRKEKGIAEKDFRERIRKFEEYLKANKLIINPRINYPIKDSDLTVFSEVAKTRRTLKKIERAERSGDATIRKREVGELMGYPKSAVSAFVSGHSIEKEGIPLTKIERKLLNFRLSKKWQRELGWHRRNIEILKKRAPALYELIARES